MSDFEDVKMDDNLSISNINKNESVLQVRKVLWKLL